MSKALVGNGMKLPIDLRIVFFTPLFLSQWSKTLQNVEKRGENVVYQETKDRSTIQTTTSAGGHQFDNEFIAHSELSIIQIYLQKNDYKRIKSYFVWHLNQ